MDDTPLSDNISKLLERVRRSSQKCHFGNSDILVLAVSKTRPAVDVRAAFACGLQDFGENYVQEALTKIEALADLPLRWHFIGPIQSNKTRDIAAHFDWVHSVDRQKIARRLSEQRPQGQDPLNVCLQVNISAEQSKAGVHPDELAALAEQVGKMPGLRLRGLMCIPAPNQIEEEQRAVFRRMHALFDSLRQNHREMDTLSMGMSADMAIAIEEGSTLVRVGTAIFGPRNR